MAESDDVMGIRYWSKDVSFEVKEKPRAVKCRALREPRAVTSIQLKTLQFFRDYQDEHGYPPTGRETCQFLGRTVHAVHCQVRSLISKGAMKTSNGKRFSHGSGPSRATRLTAFGRSLTTGKAPSDTGGAVTQEKKCLCGASHFTDNALCAECARKAVT